MEPYAARARKLGWSVHSMTVGHDVMITNPDMLAKVLFKSPRVNVNPIAILSIATPPLATEVIGTLI
jgi:hypothetical protein